MKELVSAAAEAGAAVAIAMAAHHFIRPTRVEGVSMLPTFRERDYLILNRTAYRKKGPRRGDVVVFRSDLSDGKGGKKLLIKRVIALAGDHLQIQDGRVLLNGQPLQEPYLKDGWTNGSLDLMVPDRCCFCMGDNRLDSLDSRSDRIGPVPCKELLGRIVCRLWPFDRVGRIAG